VGPFYLSLLTTCVDKATFIFVRQRATSRADAKHEGAMISSQFKTKKALKSAYPREHASWHSMRNRCLRANHMNYPRYGGRGISICARWASFAAFVDDMGPKPTPKHTIDRIDNNGNYEPGNCRWATATEQHAHRRGVPRPRRHNHGGGGGGSEATKHTFAGETLTVAEWSARLGIPERTIRGRAKAGTALDSRAPGSPGGPVARLITIGTESLTLKDWLARAGIHQSAYYRRVARGMSSREALREAQFSVKSKSRKSRVTRSTAPAKAVQS